MVSLNLDSVSLSRHSQLVSLVFGLRISPEPSTDQARRIAARRTSRGGESTALGQWARLISVDGRKTLRSTLSYFSLGCVCNSRGRYFTSGKSFFLSHRSLAEQMGHRGNTAQVDLAPPLTKPLNLLQSGSPQISSSVMGECVHSSVHSVSLTGSRQSVGPSVARLYSQLMAWWQVRAARAGSRDSGCSWSV